MEENKVNFVSTDSVSVDFFKGERKIAIISDDNYDELKKINGEFRTEKYSVDSNIVHTNSELIVGMGGDEALAKAKKTALAEKTKLMLIPTLPTAEAVTPMVFDNNLTPLFFDKPFTALAVKDLLRKSPREDLAHGVDSIACLLIDLAEESTYRFLHYDDENALSLLDAIKNTLSVADTFAVPTADVGFDMMERIYSLSQLQTVDIYNSSIASRLFSLYKSEEKMYNNYVFQIAYAIYATYYSYSPQAELIIPPDRRKAIAKIKKLVPDVKVNSKLFADDFCETRYVLNDRFADVVNALNGFDNLATSYLRLIGGRAYLYREKYSANDFLEWLPASAELCRYNSALKHLYASGYLNLFDK